MPQHTPDHATHDHEQEHGGDDASVLPFHPARSSIQDTWHVERIDTELMTAQQYDLAVTTLATLITQWRTSQENAKEARKKSRVEGRYSASLFALDERQWKQRRPPATCGFKSKLISSDLVRQPHSRPEVAG